MNFTEFIVEDVALAWLEALGYAVLHGLDVAAGEPDAERSEPNYRGDGEAQPRGASMSKADAAYLDGA